MSKLYHSISEVAEMLGINSSTLRFWETEFRQLRPMRSKGNTRYYAQKDIDIIKQIQYLVNEKNLTLEGAKQVLSQKKDEVGRHQEIMERLQRVKAELQGLSKALGE